MKNLSSLLTVLVILCVALTSSQSRRVVAARSLEAELHPSPEMRRLLDTFVGDWEVSENFEVGGPGQGKMRHGNASFRTGPGVTLIEEYHSNGSAGDLHALALLWWDPSLGAYQYLTCADNEGCELRGTAKWEGKILVNSWQEKDNGKVTAFKDSFQDISPSGFRQVSEGRTDGKTIWRVITTYTRLNRESAGSESDDGTHDLSREAMTRSLGSPRPNASIGEEAKTFDRLVGAWDANFTFYGADGTVSHKKGELFFGWIIDGRAVQDLWISYPTEDNKERTIGTTIRFFDTAVRKWRVVYVMPQFNYMVTLQGGVEGDRIVLRGLDTDGLPVRWIFSEMTPDSFHWHEEKSRDAGKTWKIDEDHHMKRRS